VLFDNVGGEVLNEVLARINLNARIALCGSISNYDATPQPGPANYSNLVARRARMEGFTGLDYPTRIPEAFEALGRWPREGSLVHKEDVMAGLESAPRALLRLFSGENFGKPDSRNQCSLPRQMPTSREPADGWPAANISPAAPST
jgi:NADPH-dependent curcumin reductase CurA